MRRQTSALPAASKVLAPLAAFVLAVLPACGSTPAGDPDAEVGGGEPDAKDPTVLPQIDAGPPPTPQYAELWYSVRDRLVYIELDESDGSVVQILQSSMSVALEPGQNGVTMLDDGSLFLSRLSMNDNKTYFYRIAEPPRDGSEAEVEELGLMPDDLMIEGLYTDCDGRLYAMDTGVDNGSAEGNRLLRFTGDYVGKDFSYIVVSDLSSASVADIDDMSPGIANNEITDNPGLALDTSELYNFDYETGSGEKIGNGGTFGVHALGGPLFNDEVSRLYLLDRDAQLFEMDPVTLTLSEVLATGPTDVEGILGHSGLGGPLTDCDSGFVVE